MNIYYFDNADFKTTDIYKKFISENPGTGRLKIRATAARGAIPISGVSVVIFKMIDEYKVIFYEGITDQSGMIDCISLPTPNVGMDDLVVPTSASYYLDIIDDANQINEEYDIKVYDGICTMQNINVVPKGDM